MRIVQQIKLRQVQVCLPEALPCSSSRQQTRMQVMRSSQAIVSVVTDRASPALYKAADLLSHREEEQPSALLPPLPPLLRPRLSVSVEPGVLDHNSGGRRRAVKHSDWTRGSLMMRVSAQRDVCYFYSSSLKPSQLPCTPSLMKVKGQPANHRSTKEV